MKLSAMTADLRQQLTLLMAAGLACFLIFPAGSVRAQMEPESPTGFKPSPVQLERAITMILLCDLPILNQEYNQKNNELTSVLNYLYLQQKNLDARNSSRNQNIGELVGSFDSLGFRFDRLHAFGAAGGFVASGWSSGASVERLVAALNKQGYEFKQGGHSVQGPIDSLVSERITPEKQTRLFIAAGRHTLKGKEGTGGATLMCHQKSTTEEESMASLGVPSTATLTKIVEKGQKQPEAWVDRIIAKAIPTQTRVIAGYRWLGAEQIAALLELHDFGTKQTLASNTHISLSSSQIDAVLESGVGIELVRTRYESLSEAQRQRLKANPATAQEMRLRGGGADAVAAFASIVREQGDGKAQWAMQFLPGITEEIADVLLEYGSENLRAFFAMTPHIQFTPRQIERMLQDKNREVQIGILRRKDISLTAEQVARGINHPDEELAFWYRGRGDYIPTAEQIEKGLTNTNAIGRRAWVGNKRIALTPEQTARALADTDSSVRRAALERPEVSFSESLQDACTNDPDFGVRSSCVSRSDYTLTQARFESIASDRNPNVLRAFLSRKGAPKVELESYVDEAIRTASDTSLMAIAANKAVPLTAKQIETACEIRFGKTQKEFCCRVSPRR